MPKFCENEIKKKQAHLEASVIKNDISSSTGQLICQHSKKCNVCNSIERVSVSEIKNKIHIHEMVKISGKHNFEHCKIPVNNKINTDYMKSMLKNYNDTLVCDLLKYGFPIGFLGDEHSLPKQ